MSLQWLPMSTGIQNSTQSISCLLFALTGLSSLPSTLYLHPNTPPLGHWLLLSIFSFYDTFSKGHLTNNLMQYPNPKPNLLSIPKILFMVFIICWNFLHLFQSHSNILVKILNSRTLICLFTTFQQYLEIIPSTEHIQQVWAGKSEN